MEIVLDNSRPYHHSQIHYPHHLGFTRAENHEGIVLYKIQEYPCSHRGYKDDRGNGVPQQGEEEKKQDDDNIVHAKIPSIHFDSATVFYNVVGRQRDCGWIISLHDLVVARVYEILPVIFEIIFESDDGCASVGMVPSDMARAYHCCDYVQPAVSTACSILAQINHILALVVVELGTQEVPILPYPPSGCSSQDMIQLIPARHYRLHSASERARGPKERFKKGSLGWKNQSSSLSTLCRRSKKYLEMVVEGLNGTPHTATTSEKKKDIFLVKFEFDITPITIIHFSKRRCKVPTIRILKKLVECPFPL
ncbi:hypothetical protein NC651_003486 [Populus alba x Populus x berolinensis]|nr:hypothetical protein NC651_003486 [Populus alba x Populus x berolinensis]